MNSKIYEKGYIYKISSKDGTKNYYGSTCNYEKRISVHKYHYERYLQGKMNYITSFEIIQEPGYKTELLLVLADISQEELWKIEQMYIRTYDCVNTKLKKTKEQIRLDKQQNRKAMYTCECGIASSKNHKARHEKSFYHKNYINTKNRQAMNIATQINITNLTINQAT